MKKEHFISILLLWTLPQLAFSLQETGVIGAEAPIAPESVSSTDSTSNEDSPKPAETKDKPKKTSKPQEPTSSSKEAPKAQSGSSDPKQPTAAAPAVPDGPLLVLDFKYQNPEKSFQMQVPSDWDVKTDFNGYEVFMEPKVKLQPTPENPVVADPNITVKVLNKTVYLDDQGLNDYEKEIYEKFTEANGQGNEFQIFQKNLFEINPQRKAFLFDITFKRNGYEVFQTILVTATEGRMYRLTLTDYKLFFDKNRERYFPILASVAIDGPAPVRVPFYMAYLPWAIGLVVVLVGLFVARMIWRRSAESGYASSSGDTDYSDQPHSTYGGQSYVSGTSEYKSESLSSIGSVYQSQPSKDVKDKAAASEPLASEFTQLGSLPLSQAVGSELEKEKDKPKTSKKDNKEDSGFSGFE